jgi:hypothetical protein
VSEEALRRVLERIDEDEAFRTRMKDDWEDAIDELDLSPAELVALSTQDEDALRRLVGADVGGFALAGGPGAGNLLGTAALCTFTSCRWNNTQPGSGCGAGGGGGPGGGSGAGTGNYGCRHAG